MTDDLRKGKDILGMPVFSIQEGKRLGDVLALLVDRQLSSVAAITVGSKLTQAGRTVPYQSLRLVGVDIVLVDSEARLEEALPPEAVREFEGTLPGRPIITQSGQRLGTVMGILVHTTSGAIEAYRMKPESGLMSRVAATVMDRSVDVPASLVQAVGPNALIVSDEAAHLEDQQTAEEDLRQQNEA